MSTIDDDQTPEEQAFEAKREIYRGRMFGAREWFSIGYSAANARERIENEAARFWSDVQAPEGMTAEQVKAELTDFHFMLGEVPKVYMEVTNGTLSKPNYHASTVISVFNDRLTEMVDERVAEELADQSSAWTGVDEHTPEPGRYLVASSWGVREAQRCALGGGVWWQDIETRSDEGMRYESMPGEFRVTHWMSLPAPPQADSGAAGGQGDKP